MGSATDAPTHVWNLLFVGRPYKAMNLSLCAISLCVADQSRITSSFYAENKVELPSVGFTVYSRTIRPIECVECTYSVDVNLTS